MTEKTESGAWETADNWKSAAIALAICTPIVTAFTLPWIFGAAGEQAMLHRVQIVGAAAAVGLALVTFCTVVWRGIIATEQAKLQRAQIDKLTEQIAAAKESNIADLLQRGAELVAEREKAAHVSAGIAILQSLAVDESGRFAQESLDLLADLAETEFKVAGLSNSFQSARQALRLAERQGRASERHIDLEAGTDFSWGARFDGVRRVTYSGGKAGQEFLDDVISAKPQFQFWRTNIVYANVKVTEAFKLCVFNHCRILGIENDRYLKNYYSACNFSGVVFKSAQMFKRMEIEIEQENWYDPKHPPVCDGDEIDWTEYFLEENPIPF